MDESEAGVSERVYKVWAFEKVASCYDCAVPEQTRFEFPVDHVTLTEEDFKDFTRGASLVSDRDYVFLYMAPPAVVDGKAHSYSPVMSALEAGRTSKKRDLENRAKQEEKNRKAEAKRAAKELETEAKKLADEKKTFERLRKKFG